MQIVYVYGGCSPTKYNEYVEKRGLRIQQPAQKYSQLLLDGFVANGVNVDVISSRPINRSVDNRIFFKSEKDAENGINYNYVSFFNRSFLRKISVFVNVFFKTLFFKMDKKTTVMCDALNIAASFGALFAAKLRRKKTVGIVTDVPCHRPDNTEVPFNEKLNLWLIKRFDSYLLLTEQMNEIVNPKKRPYVVLEGHCDIGMQEIENRIEDKDSKKICLYAGTLRRIYGIENLVRGFVKAAVPNTELHIYGAGDFKEELQKLATEYKTVKYMGIAPNSEIVEAELKATLLVNPRPTNEEYTKYSFPSKNMEYMASGTPVLTTKLPGMPQEYNKYVYLLEDESADGVCAALKEILTKPAEELHQKGLDAKNFVMEEKNNCVQAKKVLEMIEGVYKCEQHKDVKKGITSAE